MNHEAQPLSGENDMQGPAPAGSPILGAGHGRSVYVTFDWFVCKVSWQQVHDWSQQQVTIYVDLKNLSGCMVATVVILLIPHIYCHGGGPRRKGHVQGKSLFEDQVLATNITLINLSQLRRITRYKQE
jgi:hypothetical protein